uniref:Uncharacterized protein n=1 Tax=Anaerobacillus isosaccharinicus TaxID=1532552 RepID=A0A1S2LHN4_9BACI
MKKGEWVIATSFIIVGLACLTMAIIFSLGHYSTLIFFGFLIQICLWFLVPFLLIMALYITLKINNK